MTDNSANSSQTAGLVINLVFDANALAAPQSFRDGMQAAANELEAAIHDPITVNIGVGYGEINGSPLHGAFSEGSTNGGILVDYSAVRAALAADETSAVDVASVDALPATVSLSGQTQFSIASAEAKALGVVAANNPAIDGYVGMNTSATGNGLISVALHEITHAMGRVAGGGSVLDLFRYTSAGNHLYTFSTPSAPAYFSIDGGNTDLADFGIFSDPGDFLNPGPTSFGPPYSTLTPNDPFDETGPGNVNLTPVDLTLMDVLGFDVSATPPPSLASTPTITTSNSFGLTVRNVTLPEKGVIPGSQLITSVSAPSGDSITTYGFEDSGSGNGHFVVDGTVQPNGQFTLVLDTQLSAIQYVGGSSPASERLFVIGFDDTTKTYSPDATLTATTTAATIANLAVLDTSTNQVIAAVNTPYSGPVAGLQEQYIYSGSDNLNVSVATDNWFVHTGSGEDAVQVLGGTNVLDGGPGSNFLYGANGQDEGTDTFFVDDRSIASPVYSTMVNFHKGDAATIFGITQAGFNFQWADNQGAVGFQGLTLHVTNANAGNPAQTEASLTLPGRSTADLSNGSLSVSFGSESDGTPYMYLFANA